MKFLIVGLLALALAAPASARSGNGGVAAKAQPQVEVHRGLGYSRDLRNLTPRVVKMLAAANHIAHRPYVWGGGHGAWRSRGYDCSGSVSYVLHKAGLLGRPRVSGDLAHFGKPGRGKYVTIYANAGHVWMTIAGVRYDTSALRINGSRWTKQRRPKHGFVVRHPAGL